MGNSVNRPAGGCWLVPGCRILKNEPFSRLTEAELGLRLDIKSARYLGLYEHFYPVSIFTDERAGITVCTHYVVNGFEITLPDTKHDFPVEQHGAYQWFTEDELMVSNKVHVHSKWYFDNYKGFM